MRPTNRMLPGILLLPALAAVVFIGILCRDQIDGARIQAWVLEVGIAAPLVFVLVYALAAVAFLPGAVLTLAGGALFGPALGTLYNLVGATLGATLAFLAARHLAPDWLETKARGRLKRVVEGVEAEGWRFVAFVRLVPLFPFNLLNYLLGLTRLPLVPYVVATAIFMLPGALAYTYLGYVGREAAAGSEGLLQKGLLALALLAIVAFTPRMVVRWRIGSTMEVQQLKEGIDAAKRILVLDVRTEADFLGGRQGHIDGALNIPLETLEGRFGELDRWSEQTVAIIGRTDRRSAQAATLLARHGFADVRVVPEGMAAWIAADLPVISPPSIPKENP